MQQCPSTQDNWLSLGEASKLLGVHPATLRSWADQGHVHAYRTPGRHRRFLRTELDRFVLSISQPSDPASPLSGQLMANTMDQLKHDLSDGRIEKPWIAAFDQNELPAWRESGRRLLGLAIQYVARSEGREQIVAQAQALAREYGRVCSGHAVPLAEMVHAYMFFRESVLRTARPGQVERGQYDSHEVRVHRELRQYLDHVLYAMLAAYDRPNTDPRLQES